MFFSPLPPVPSTAQLNWKKLGPLIILKNIPINMLQDYSKSLLLQEHITNVLLEKRVFQNGSRAYLTYKI